MATKVYKEGYMIIVDPPLQPQIKYTLAKNCRFGFDGDTVWIKDLVEEVYIFNDLESNMLDANGKPIGEGGAESYLLGFIGEVDSSELETSYKIALNPPLETYINLNERVNISNPDGTWYIETDVIKNSDNNSNRFLASSSTTQARITIYSVGRIQLKNDSNATLVSSNNILPTTGRFKLRMEHLADTTTKVYVDDVLKYTFPAMDGTFSFNYIGRQLSTEIFDGDIIYLDMNGETFRFTEGSGSSTTSSTGRITTLSSTGTVEDMWEQV